MSCPGVSLTLRLLHISHKAPYLPRPPQILHNRCISFLLGITAVLREIENNAYPNVFFLAGGGGGGGGGGKKVGLWEICNWPIQHGGFVLWERLAAQGLNELNQGQTDAMIFKDMLTRF